MEHDDNHGAASPALPGGRLSPSRQDGQHRVSYETTGSSSVGASGSGTLNLPSSLGDPQHLPDEHESPDARLRRRHRSRPSASGFLLQDTPPGPRGVASRRRAGSGTHKGKESPWSPKTSSMSPGHGSGSSSSPMQVPKSALQSPAAKSGTQGPQGSPPRGDDEAAARPLPKTRQRADLDDDSTQIISMALNLSESRRRAASHRHPSRSNPPRLASLPVSSSKTNLSQHLQQQRKTSRTGSPKPHPSPVPRVSSGFRINSPLQPSHDPGPDDHIRYNFSTSTLSRAQKAKEHLELMAEYRRLLTHLPPLKPGRAPQSNATSQPGSPGIGPTDANPSSQGAQLPLGRPYNPLQYIRNRKVRTRERKVIDGEHLGFADVESVRSWVDKLGGSNSTDGEGITRGGFSMPEFPSAEDPDTSPSPDNMLKQVRSRRPRVDWFFDPCDMVADAYWLEQDHHKQLIEDRLWRRIFPPLPEPLRPPSRMAEDAIAHVETISGDVPEHDHDMQDVRLVHTADEIPGTRDRAKQKFPAIAGFRHRHHGSSGSHHEPWSRRESISDASGSDNDTRPDFKRKFRHGRRDTITSDASDLLQKQMLDIVSQEAKDRELADLPETNVEHLPPSEHASPNLAPTPHISSQGHSRKTSVVDFSDSELRLNNTKSRFDSPPSYPLGRPSIEITDERGIGSGTDIDASAPASPGLNSKDHILGSNAILDIPALTGSLGSPTRNPISKVRRRFRDKSHDAGAESQSDAEDDSRKQTPAPETLDLSERPTHVPAEEAYKTHRSTGSMRMRGDEQSVGLRGLFKAPRIDTVIRGGVSKLGDMIWKRDGSDTSSDDSSSDESDDEISKVQTKHPIPLSRQESRRLEDEVPENAKHFIDTMPQFNHVNHTRSKSSTGQLLDTPSGSRPLSRQSSRWEQLKPPRIDVHSTSTDTPVPEDQPAEADGSRTDADSSDVPDGVREADQRLNRIISAPVPQYPYRPNSQNWSITDYTTAPERAQLSKREVARMRTLILSSGIKAMEINRRANEKRKPLSRADLDLIKENPRRLREGPLPWADIARLTSDNKDLREEQVTAYDMYPFAARALAMSIQSSGQRWQTSVDRFTNKTTPELQKRIRDARSRVADDFSLMTRQAGDKADEANRELAFDQPLKVKHVIDVIEKLLRNRRRRFRWVRRMLWLTVEWVLVGIMWFVWLVVTILRVFRGIERGVVGGVRWLLWL